MSVLIPAYNAAADLGAALEGLAQPGQPDFEVIVADDGSTDGTAEVAEASALHPLVLRLTRGGPARARNRAAARARADVLVFLDADVVVHADTLPRILTAFTDPDLDALMGSYDDRPHHPQFLSQYRNLMHCYYHRTGQRGAGTWWSGCGAMRRAAFIAMGGFDEGWRWIEDIELGYRLRAAGRRIALLPEIQVQHRKRWTFLGMLRTDIVGRGIPWTELILRDGRAPGDLNLGRWQRASVAAAGLMVAAAALGSWGAAAALAAGIVWWNRKLLVFFAERRGWWFALRTVPLFVLYLLYSGLAFGLGVAKYTWKRLRKRPTSLQASG